MSEQQRVLTPYLKPSGAWALSLGTAIGWGSLVITATTYLAQAGPLGSVLGLAVGMLVMLVIARNYQYLINCCPESGGAYTYARDIFGYDHGFFVAWFLLLTYFAILWANATALPLFARYFLGEIFEFGKLYTVFGYDVYIGEALLTIAGVLLTAWLVSRHRHAAARAMTALVICFTAAIAICFIGAMIGLDRPLTPAFVPDTNALGQILNIAVITPWAFIGFENISHATEEFSFRTSRTRRILIVVVVTTTLLYIFITLLSTTAYPERYGSWLEYIRDIGSLEGIEGLPAFYAAQHYMGSAGVAILMLALLSLVITSLIGNTLTLSRLVYALAKDRILPKRYADLNDRVIPGRAVGLVAGVCAVIPFVGRTAIGWIVDVTTLGATLVYAFVSACAFKKARQQEDRLEQWTGMAGLVVMVLFELISLVPSLFTTGAMETETYFLFVAWSVLGFVYFRYILRRDKENRFGRSIIVWIALLSLMLFVSLVWMSQSVMSTASRGIDAVEAYYQQEGIQEDIGIGADQMILLRQTNARSMLVVVALFGVALGVLVNNYATMSHRALESESQLQAVRNMANTDPLTGVKSKHAFAEREKEINAAIEKGEADDFALVVCDVNGLKHVNDTLGHKAGDEYIRAASQMICELFAHSPVFRTGGDEFVVYLHGHDYERRQEILKALHDQSVSHIAEGGVVVSGGLSGFDRTQDKAFHDIFERADALMYTEKQTLKSMGAITR